MANMNVLEPALPTLIGLLHSFKTCGLWTRTITAPTDRDVRDIDSSLGWCELELLFKSPNPQADYGSMIIPEQLLLQVFGHRMYQFLQNWP